MKKVLVAIHSDILRNAYADVLEKDGFEVIKTSNGKEAFEMAQKEKPAVVLAGTMLTEIGGFTLLKKITEESEAIKRTPVIIFAQYESKEERKVAMELEASDFLALSSTPPAEIVNRVRILLGEQKSYRVKVSENTEGVPELLESLNQTSLKCPKCGAERQLLLIKDLSNGDKRFIVSFVCPNNCN